MDRETLRKVQLVQLEIANEIKRVCEKNNIKFFLDSGSLLGAVRHKGFIPWDDDLDIGMLRDDYEHFCRIADRELDSKYVLQTWVTDDDFPLPFAKVRKRGTVYLEKRSHPLSENGFFVDILPYDFAPNSNDERQALRKKQGKIFECLLMKSKWTPWVIKGKTNWKVRLYYLKSQLISILKDRNALIKEYMDITLGVRKSGFLYLQTGKRYYPVKLFENTVYVPFENTQMPIIEGHHEWLTIAYGDYMTPPPEDERENMHEIYKLDFGQE